ncbi:MAG: hypothetical protein J0H65_13205 [Rhizobiales bacterium]|nr:hypothetical protein [Hyphomicrobiales bacterium]
MRIDVALLLCTALALAAAPARAAPLDPETCTTLKTEYDGLVAAGAKADMDRGPAWAKANLTPDRLGKIERLLAVGEQLSFRCGDQVTARPALKELPKPEGGKGTLSNIPLPKRKDADAARKHAAQQ